MARELNILCTNALNILCEDINDWATEKGWNETPDSTSFKAEQIALMHSELSEMLEYVRMKPTWHCPIHGHVSDDDAVGKCEADETCQLPLDKKPPLDDHIPIPGEHAELADLAIRLFHYCGRRGINLGEAVRMKHAYNINRPYRHGKNI